jgi:hypothetical protein
MVGATHIRGYAPLVFSSPSDRLDLSWVVRPRATRPGSRPSSNTAWLARPSSVQPSPSLRSQWRLRFGYRKRNGARSGTQAPQIPSTETFSNKCGDAEADGG